jgi:hypothetical protein
LNLHLPADIAETIQHVPGLEDLLDQITEVRELPDSKLAADRRGN